MNIGARIFITAAAITATVAAAALTGPAGAAGAQTPVGPNQHFIGLVNGGRSLPVVKVVCPGPSRSGQTGPVAGGQTLKVIEAAHGSGFTGFFSQIYAWVVPPARATARPAEQTFTVYGKSEPFPTGARAPCGGTGRIEFSSCPYLAPCAAGWIPTYVKVQFENIAV